VFVLSTGFGLGAAFTLFPATVGEVYGAVNFGICMQSRMSRSHSHAQLIDHASAAVVSLVFGLVQFGSAGASIFTPILASFIANHVVCAYTVCCERASE
jgi:hypothetical protein